MTEFLTDELRELLEWLFAIKSMDIKDTYDLITQVSFSLLMSSVSYTLKDK